jgi:ABC-type transport system involved in multi-copper enzyme maturation permease subunit
MRVLTSFRPELLREMEIAGEGSNSIGRILTIARNTFREAVRDRILYNLVVFVLLITAAAVLLGELTDGQEGRTIVDLGLSAILIFGTFISIFVGVSLVSKEIEKKTVYAILSKPVRRGEFIIGKYLGLCLTLMVNTAIMGVGVSLALVYVGSNELAFNAWGAISLIYLELTITTAVAIVFSSFSTPALSALFTFLIFVIGHFSSALRQLATSIDSVTAKLIFNGIYYLLPNLSNFTFITESAHGITPPAPMFLTTAVYAILFDVVLITIAILIFSRRNFK